MNREDWLRYGYDHNYCSPPVCCSHNGVPMTDDESEDGDMCFTIVRVYNDTDEHTQVHEQNTWLKVVANNLGWNNDT